MRKYIKLLSNIGIVLLAMVGANHLGNIVFHREVNVPIQHELVAGAGEHADIQNRLNMLIQIYDASTGYTKELARELIVAEGQPQESVLPFKQRAIVEEMYWRAPKTLSIRVGDDVKVQDKILMGKPK